MMNLLNGRATVLENRLLKIRKTIPRGEKLEIRDSQSYLGDLRLLSNVYNVFLATIVRLPVKKNVDNVFLVTFV